MKTLSKQLSAEAIGTFFLVFVGTGAIVVNDQAAGAITHLGVALSFGLVVMCMIYALGDISGAHFNPAVTLGFVAARRMPLKTAGLFIASQLSGALLASLCLSILFPLHEHLGASLPSGSTQQSFILETLLTFLLMFIILGVSTGSKEKGITAGLAIGACVMMAALFGGPISGASMNPARSVGPAVATNQYAFLWIYILAPLLGALFAVLACRCVREENCCTR